MNLMGQAYVIGEDQVKNTPPKFHYPADIQLQTSPLVEAWLEIRWQLQSGEVANLMRDPGFPFALGAFYSSIKDEFGHREDLDASHMPEEMLPHVVRHRFRPAQDESPLLQLGPGVASVNFTTSYTWNDFEQRALYLREKLLGAYDVDLKTLLVALRYRNVMPFEYSSESLLRFLERNLNISIGLPIHIPGSAASTGLLSGARFVMTFDLYEPVGAGTIRTSTGTRTHRDATIGKESQKEEIVVWEMEVLSKDPHVPQLDSGEQFREWLGAAHAVIHEWFFSLIDGPLYRMYKSEM